MGAKPRILGRDDRKHKIGRYILNVAHLARERAAIHRHIRGAGNRRKYQD